jgi:hypothetical protein
MARKHIYHEYCDIYNIEYVFDSVIHKKSLFQCRIDPHKYQKALCEFITYGKLIHFPTKYIYRWMGSIMRNIAILKSCTYILNIAHDISP